MSIRDDSIEDLAEVIREGYYDTLDMEGPNFEVMAAAVFDHLFDPPPKVHERARLARQAAARLVASEREYQRAAPAGIERPPAVCEALTAAYWAFGEATGLGFAADELPVAELLLDLLAQPEDLVLANQVLVAVPEDEGDAVSIVVSGRVHDLWRRAAGAEA